MNGTIVKVKNVLEESPLSIRSLDLDDRTPLHISSIQGFIEISKLLLENNGEIDALDNSTQTALHYAAFQGHTGKCFTPLVIHFKQTCINVAIRLKLSNRFLCCLMFHL